MTQEHTPTLKPCPFCKSFNVAHGQFSGGAHVECLSCGAAGPEVPLKLDCGFEALKKAISLCIEKWNTRACKSHDALELAERVQWQPIENAPKGKTILIAYKNDCGKWRTEKACYFKKGTLEADGDCVSEDMYDEDADNYYAPEGWYIDVEAASSIGVLDYSYLALHENPTHWMPVPAAPAQEGGAK